MLSALATGVVASITFSAVGAGATPVSDTQNHLNQVNNQLSQEQAQAGRIESQLQADGARLDELSQQYELAQEHVQSLDDQLASTKAQIALTEAHIAATQLVLRHAALQSYMTGADEAGIESLFATAGEKAQVVEEYRQVAGSQLTAAVDAMHQAQEALSAEQAQLQSTETAARAAASQVASSEQQAEQVAAAQKAALSQVKGQLATLLAQQQQAKQAYASALYQQQLAQQQAARQASANRGISSNVPVSPGAQGAVQAAETQLGVPYRWGAESPRGSPDPGFDCSGLTQWSWRQAGVGLPRTAQEQYDAIPHVAMSDLKPGDLVFWNDGTDSVQHVGMYVGNGDVIDAPQTGEDVQIQPIWTNGLVGAGRP